MAAGPRRCRIYAADLTRNGKRFPKYEDAA